MSSKKSTQTNQELFSLLTDKKNIKKAEEIIQNGNFELNAIDEEGQQAIHYAAYYGLTRIIELLAEKGADVNAKAVETKLYRSTHTKNWTPLHFLANSDHYANEKSALVLLQHGANIDSKDDNKDTPLLVLQDTDQHRKIAILLLDQGADINAVNKQHENVLSKQISSCSLDFVQELIKRKINLKGKSGVMALCLAIQNQSIEYVKLLLENGVNITPTGDFNPLGEAISGGDWETFSLLIEHGADISKTKEKLLLESICGDGDPVVRRKIAELCLKDGIDFSKKNANLINIAGSFDADWAIELLVKHGADINHVDKEKRTPLVHAALRDHRKTIEALLKHGVDLSGESGVKALLYSSDFSIAKMLVSAGVDLNKLYDGYTVLQSAVERLQYKKVKLYLENKADPNIQGKNKELPLAYAVSKGRTDIIQLLLLHGADKSIAFDKKVSVADLAAKSKKSDVAALFNMSKEELMAYQPKRPYLRFVNAILLFASGVDTWNDVIKSQVKKIFGKMDIETIKAEVGEIEYFDVVNESGTPLYQLALFNYGDGALFTYNKASYIGHIVQHGFDISKSMTSEAKDDLRDKLADAYGNFEGKIKQSVDFTKC